MRLNQEHPWLSGQWLVVSNEQQATSNQQREKR